MTDDNARITTLTTDAIRATGEKMIADIHAQVKMVDEMAAGIHVLARKYEEEIGARTLALTDHITAYTALGAKTTEMFKAMSEAMKPLKQNGHAETQPQNLDELKTMALRSVEKAVASRHD